MNYLQFYCDSFRLKIKHPYVFDKNEKKIGKVDPGGKYIHFYSEDRTMKVSDLLMLGIERISVHD